jgi:hypothetical protein
MHLYEDNVLTLEQVYEMFKDVKVKFVEYYKYTFSYEGKHNGYSIFCTEGGDGDDIYKHTVTPKPVNFINIESYNKEPSLYHWRWVEIKKGKKVVFTMDNGW